MRMAMEQTVSLLRRAQSGKIPMTIAQAQKMAADHVRESLGGLIRSSDPETLRRIAGDDALSRFAGARDHAVDSQPGRQVPGEQPAAGPGVAAMKRRSTDDVLASLRGR